MNTMLHKEILMVIKYIQTNSPFFDPFEWTVDENCSYEVALSKRQKKRESQYMINKKRWNFSFEEH